MPLADALNANLFGSGRPPHHLQEGPLASNDSGMKQTVFVNGHLWAALSTVAKGAPAGGHSHGANQTGVAWYDLTPTMSAGGTLSASLANSGLIDTIGANLLFPAITMNDGGQGAIAVTLVGNHRYPSAAYVPIGADGSSGDVVVANAGAGPQDGFTEYGGPGPRWGDYGAGAVDPATGNLWIASEASHQTCSFSAYLADATCGGTRTTGANWSTQITQIPEKKP